MGFQKLIIFILASLLFINTEGVDSVDYLILPALLIMRLDLWIKKVFKHQFFLITCVLFTLSYIFSIANGAEWSFVVNFMINVALFTILSAFVNNNKNLIFVIYTITFSFIATVLISIVQQLDLVPTLATQFDIVRDGRFMAMYGDPNIIGAFLTFPIIYFFNEILYKWKQSKILCCVNFSIFLTLTITLIFTQSRSAWLAVAIGICVYFVFLLINSQMRKITLGLFIISLILAFGLLFLNYFEYSDQLLDRLSSFSDSKSDAERERIGLVYTISAIEVAINNPFGVGPGMTSHVSGIVSENGQLLGAHNTFVQVFSDNGVVAGIAFIFVFICATLRAARDAIANRYIMGLSQVVVASSLISLFVCALFQDLIQWKLIWIFPAIYFSCILVPSCNITSET